MYQIHYKGRPKPAERPRARFSLGNKNYYLYTPPTYEKYKRDLIEHFNKFENEKEFAELFDPKTLVYGLSVKIVFRLKGKGKQPFYGKRPDIDNLMKAIFDGLFQSNVNLIEDGIETDKEGNPVVDYKGVPLPHFKQKIDDSRIVHTETLKLRVDTEEEEGFHIILRNVGKDEIS